MAGAQRAQGVRAPVWAKWRRLSWQDRRLLAEAFPMLALSSLMVRFAYFRFIARTASWGHGRKAMPKEMQRHLAGRVRWALEACSRRLPWKTVCFQQGLAAQWMLRRRGIPSQLFFGATQAGSTGLEAHVWVRIGDIDVVGEKAAPRFAALACFPSHPLSVPDEEHS